MILLAFIIEKNLDTPTLPLLTFAQKVSTVLPPLELFSLERKGHLLPGGLFVCVLSHDRNLFHPGDTEARRRLVHLCGCDKIPFNGGHPEASASVGERESRDLHLLYGKIIRR